MAILLEFIDIILIGAWNFVKYDVDFLHIFIRNFNNNLRKVLQKFQNLLQQYMFYLPSLFFRYFYKLLFFFIEFFFLDNFNFYGHYDQILIIEVKRS